MTLAERYMEKGKAEGKVEGKIEGKMEVAKNLIVKGLSTNDIVEVTGLDEKEINKVKQQMLH
ncbi:hypothetical protein J8TS2_33090 [Lederbergia ruris]|uniref:Transposase n=1 Tax=Lederbergia ruris TaxID=217495 RepID=A0ABQ4KM39_9BACI|nr:hypothetical protein [Lederbergia ruris]GIN58990.1 hypothetical protein J8TS2_33090 [Lederbergia ruris]